MVAAEGRGASVAEGFQIHEHQCMQPYWWILRGSGILFTRRQAPAEAAATDFGDADLGGRSTAPPYQQPLIFLRSAAYRLSAF